MAKARLGLLAYLAGTMACVSISDPNAGLIDIPVSFILKNKLQMDASEVAEFRLIASTPLYLALLFGLVRDKMNQVRVTDRRLMVAFCLCNVLSYSWFSFMPASYVSLLVANVITTCFFLVVLSAQSAMIVSFAQQNSLTGPTSAFWNFISYLSSAAAFVIGGYVSEMIGAQSTDRSAQTVYQIGIAASLATLLMASSQPKALTSTGSSKDSVEEKRTLRGLLSHRSVYPALGIWLLWNFAPGAATPLQYYLQNSLGSSDAQWGLWNAVFTTAFLPAFVIYGLLSLFVSFRRLLFWSAVVAIPQFLPLLLVKTLDQAMLFAFAAGLIGGMATSAYLDLTIRSCPPGFEGTMIMASSAIYFLSTRLGDVVGSYLYARSGSFQVCVALMTAIYSFIALVLFVVPRTMIDNQSK